jgi:hypothetical protein
VQGDLKLDAGVVVRTEDGEWSIEGGRWRVEGGRWTRRWIFVDVASMPQIIILVSPAAPISL